MFTLSVGSVLIFEEILGPETGNPGDADPTHRWAVRLTQIQINNYKNCPLVDPLNGQPITRIWWASDDALPFPLCISSTTDPIDGSVPLTDVSVAFGNVIAADHGIWQDWEDLGVVPAPPLPPVTQTSCSCGSQSSLPISRPRYYPQLSQSPLTYQGAYNLSGPATSFIGASSSSTSSPTAQLCVRDDQGQDWVVQPDLLSSTDLQKVCVAEIESDGTVFLRFGDGQYGAAPEMNASFQARYRIGIGIAGNIGRDSLAHIADRCGRDQVGEQPDGRGRRGRSRDDGTDPPAGPLRLPDAAPRRDRGRLRDPGPTRSGDQCGARHVRWTGSWYTAFVSIDAAAGDVPTASLLATTKQRLNLLRMAGVDLEVEGAVIVGLRIEMSICVDPDHFQGDVERR